jgi:hypothetical protein
MTIQEIINPTERYLIRGWDEDRGDPKIDIEVRAGNYNQSLFPLADLAESVRTQVTAVPTIELVEVRHVQVGGFTETVIPAP